MIVVVLAVMAASLTFSAPAFASHEHYLVTPGTCVEDVASGQTEKGPGEGGYHKFHENVHLGTPGMMAFESENNPVAVYKTGTGPGCPTESCSVYASAVIARRRLSSHSRGGNRDAV